MCISCFTITENYWRRWPDAEMVTGNKSFEHSSTCSSPRCSRQIYEITTALRTLNYHHHHQLNCYNMVLLKLTIVATLQQHSSQSALLHMSQTCLNMPKARRGIYHAEMTSAQMTAGRAVTPPIHQPTDDNRCWWCVEAKTPDSAGISRHIKTTAANCHLCKPAPVQTAETYVPPV